MAHESARRQSRQGLLLAALVLAAWCVLQAYAHLQHRWDLAGWLAAPLLTALLCWLNVGLFIVAHDALHGSLAPALPRLSRAVGWMCLMLYAGFQLSRFEQGHQRHHRHAGSDDDPDFQHADGGGHFWSWYLRFLRSYLGLPELAGVVLGTVLFAVLSDWSHAIAFWALPGMLASLQLFAFGTWLPHRPGIQPFIDQHRARSSSSGNFVSLLQCFHFGYHHEHHLRPDLPWWRLPAFKRSSLRVGAATVTPDAGPALRSRAGARGWPVP